jgi:hypothetical protein
VVLLDGYRCDCKSGYIHDWHTQGWSLETQTQCTAALAPTQDGDECHDSHGCDTQSTRCIVRVVEGGEGSSFQHCSCIEGYVEDPDSIVSCRSTTQPTASPTHDPTENHCPQGDFGCDTSSTFCMLRSPDEHRFECVCLEGYVPALDSILYCDATIQPTHSPTDAPTEMPTVVAPTEQPTWQFGQGPSKSPTPSPTCVPTVAPTHKPTGEMCEDGGDHGCDPLTTICVMMEGIDIPVCECLEGYVSCPNDPRKCVESAPPTVVPSAAPTEAQPPSEQPTVLEGWEVTPTHMPTGKQCADGTHPCDTHTSMCMVWQEATGEMGEMYECVCLEGFERNPHEPTSCMLPARQAAGQTVFG